MKTPTIVFLALLNVAAGGCALERAEIAEQNAPTAQLAGEWTGSAGTGGQFIPITMMLTQNGTAVKGTIEVGGRPCRRGARHRCSPRGPDRTTGGTRRAPP